MFKYSDSFLIDALSKIDLEGKRVLLIIPDGTRTAPVGSLVKAVYKALVPRTKRIDTLIALGTHKALDRISILTHLGMSEQEYQSEFPKLKCYNHEWNNKEALCSLGVLKADQVRELTNGLLDEEIPLSINRTIFDYDHLLVLSPVFPHEIAGISGGSKYFFPGISGPEIIDITHWLAAKVSCVRIIGRIDTPVRRILDAAVQLIPFPITAISFIMQIEDDGGIDAVSTDQIGAMFIGPLFESWRRAAELVPQFHFVHKRHPFRTVLAFSPRMYEDMWTGGKCVYKCEAVVDDGGELIVYAPHIESLSYNYEHLLYRIGYHVAEYFESNMSRFLDVPKAVLAVSAFVRGAGTYTNGIERPRIKVTLATKIPKSICDKVGLGYLDPMQIDLSAWKNREDEGILFVERAGERLYLLESKVY
jgi:nickel-dependent lactate racemase